MAMVFCLRLNVHDLGIFRGKNRNDGIYTTQRQRRQKEILRLSGEQAGKTLGRISFSRSSPKDPVKSRKLITF